MTTVACRDGVMASDSQQTIGKIVADGHTKKVFRLNDGRLVGFAGQVSQWEHFIHQMNATTEKLPHIQGCKHVTALVTDGTWIYVWEGGWERPQKGGFFAIGNGMFFAIAAMKAGATAPEAVKIATEMDVYSGGRVQQMKING